MYSVLVANGPSEKLLNTLADETMLHWLLLAKVLSSSTNLVSSELLGRWHSCCPAWLWLSLRCDVRVLCLSSTKLSPHFALLHQRFWSQGSFVGDCNIIDETLPHTSLSNSEAALLKLIMEVLVIEAAVDYPIDLRLLRTCEG